MIALQFPNLEELKRAHYNAVKSYVQYRMKRDAKLVFYAAVVALPEMQDFPRTYDENSNDYTWLERFVLADLTLLQNWVREAAPLLKFTEMKKLYTNCFSKSPKVFVDVEKTYNAYRLFQLMDISVCPYCEHELIEVVAKEGEARRTLEFDHFFPKGDNDYPGLAMCFFNLIPSCKPCNQVRNNSMVDANPYDSAIETMTHFDTDLPLAINIESTSDNDCQPKLNPTGLMVKNDSVFALEQRYRNVSSEVRRLLLCKQNFPDEKLLELERMNLGTVADLKHTLFGNKRDVARGKELHTKMKEDLIGY